MVAKWNNKDYKMINSTEINKSSREVKYTDLELDFSNCTIEELPFAQQEVQIFSNDNKLKFTGFVAEYDLPELTDINISKKVLKLSLYTPRQLATKRTITIMKTTKLNNIIKQALAVLIEDGFEIKEIIVPDLTITVNLISRTVEDILNYLSKKYSLYWNIDEMKRIEVISIDNMLGKPAVKTINIDNYKEEINGLISISPKIENIDYANIINVKNARIFYDKFQPEAFNITLNNGDRIDFENPIDISYKTAKRIVLEQVEEGATSLITNLEIIYDNDKYASIVSAFNTTGDYHNGINYNNIGTDDSTGALFVLTMDTTFKNLATGITYKGDTPITIKGINSQTYLRYANMKLINWHEIEKNEGRITKTGQIEKTLDVENGWFTVKELIDYIKSTFLINNKFTNQILIKYKGKNDLKVGDKLTINLPEYFTEGEFIITAIKEIKDWCNPSLYTLELRNTNLLENFIDLFRSSSDIEEQESQVQMEYVVEYAEEEKIKEKHEIILDENYNNTLNAILRS